MSAEALGYVYRHSPYSGVIFAVHLAVADSVNDQNGNQFWMATQKLALKARTSRQSVSHALSVLTEDGWLEEVQRKDGWTVRYRFIYKPCAVVYESRWMGGVKPDDRGVSTELTGGVKPVDTNPIEPNDNPNTLRQQMLTDFDSWYSVYPRKVGKQDAFKAYRAARKGVGADVLLAGLERAKMRWERERVDARYIPHPATWLRQGRWEDGHEPMRENHRVDAEVAQAESGVSALALSGASAEDIERFIDGRPARMREALRAYYQRLCERRH